LTSVDTICAVIVTHNSERVIGPCLDALHGISETVVVDNASQDGTLREVGARPWARVIANCRNAGFAAAVNQGARTCARPHILLVNPDVVIDSGLQPLVEACAEHGLAAGVLTDDCGRPQRGFTIRRFPSPAALAFETLGVNRLWPGNPVNRRYRYLDRDLDAAGPVEQAAGAFLMIRRDVFEELGGFDESFHPLWFEDVDFALRAHQRGYSTQFVPHVRARHAGGHSVRVLAHTWRVKYWYASLLRYAAKHYGPLEFRAVCAAVAQGCFIRALTGTILSHRWGSFAQYKAVLRLALASCIAGRVSLRPEDDKELSTTEENGQEQVLTRSAQG
jgi:N-acetylglucosaminyl-diphospho-decaprenol L-rhamnosyltransferase